MESLETDRLRLRPFRLDDVDAYYAGISSDADVMRYLPGGQPRHRSDSQWVINYFMRHAELHGFGVWAVDEKASGALIGHAGLEYIPGAEEVEIAYTLAKVYWGRGYATEAAAAALCFGFETLNLPEVYGLAFPPNSASQNVMRKIGMESQGVTQRYYGLELACFHLTREVYLAAHKGDVP
ncbi:MAG: GNAT family N-acetyltransferase [Chloroflexota bacterium]